MNEEVLAGNATHPILRIGDTVHRPVSWWTPAVHELLKYLESVEFKYSPRVLGFDEQGREILTYMKGESGKEGWFKIHSDKGLQNYAKLLREYHEAVADYKPSDDSIWAYAEGGLKPGEIICHGDFGPWNLTWDGDKPVGIIDWDLVFPAKPSYDVLYALEWSAPFKNDNLAREWHHFPDIPDRKRRIDVFLDAYGANRQKIGDIVSGVATMKRTVASHEKLLAERGMQPQVDWVANGDLEDIEQQALWIEANRYIFE
jgi:hypothetical protein